MKVTYERSICLGCGTTTLITHKSKHMGECCKNKGKIRKPLKRTPIPKQSAQGKIRKAKDVDYYHQMWALSADKDGVCKCEECGQPLPAYAAKFVSHILSRQAFPDLAHHPMNHNILCSGVGLKDCHRRWETGDKANMNIYGKNQITIQLLMESRQK